MAKLIIFSLHSCRDLSSNLLPTFPLSSLSNVIPTLKLLSLSTNRITALDNFFNTTILTTLSLKNNLLTSLATDQFRGASNVKNLYVLTIEDA